MDIVALRLENAFSLTSDLAASLSEDALSLRLGDLPSNSIGEQLWCVIGARESYLRAIVNEGWSGFSCSLKMVSKDTVLKSLIESAAECLTYIGRQQLSEKQLGFAMALLEHEVQHHGQLIRYIYGNRLSFPRSWMERYTV
jgi:hypothetical protein